MFHAMSSMCAVLPNMIRGWRTHNDPLYYGVVTKSCAVSAYKRLQQYSRVPKDDI
jgi:hypothetical protein